MTTFFGNRNMARQNDEFTVAWHSLSGSDEHAGWRTIPIAPAGRCILSAGRRFPENAEALLAGFSAASIGAAERLPDGQGFAVERVDLNDDGRTWVALTRKTTGGIELFSAMVCDVAGALDAEIGADEPHLLRVFLSRVRAWQEFMRKGAQPLSAENEIGLVGELAILAAILDEGVLAASALEAWVGPLGGLRDFEIGTGGIEVKSTLSAAGFPAWVGSLDQLDDSVRQPLFVAGVRLRQAASGSSLPDSVASVRDIVQGYAAAERLLSERLVAAGYFDTQADQYSRCFHIANVRVVEVGPGFPRLTPGEAPPGIVRARYEIDLDKAPGGDIGVGAALKKLGAI